MSDVSAQEPQSESFPSNDTSPFEAFEMSTAVTDAAPVDLTVVEAVSSASIPDETQLEVPIPSQDTSDKAIPTPSATPPRTAETRTDHTESPESVKGSEKPGEIKFLDLPLRSEVQHAVQKSGYEKPTPIQAEIIPHMLEGRDVLAQSQTGTGKTAAFALPVLTRIEVGRKKPQVLVLTPTRELAIQVARSFATYGSGLRGFGVAAIYGGQDYTAQFRQLRNGVEVVVGTPGRVIDHIKRGTLDLSEIDCLVLDEADEMLNMGFLDDVQFVLDHAPDSRQIALFSATLPAPIRNISQRYLTDPARITIQKKTMTAESIRQRALFVIPREKVDVLKRILEVEETDGVIIFTNTKDASVRVAEDLNREGLSAIALNGDMPQKVRERTIEQLKAGRLDILVATDVAARGLDVTRVSHVFNFDVPQDTESYIHRIGRTGRAGRKGEAIIFLTRTQRGKLRFIERATRQTIEIVQPPTADEINAIRVSRFTEKIAAVLAEQDLSIFQGIIRAFAEESGTDMASIAAALAQIAQQGRPFFVKDRPRKEPREGYGSGNEARDRSKSPHQKGKSNSGGRQIGPPEPGKDRYRIEVGWRDGVKPGNIVGAIANEGGLSGEHIGPIKIHDSFSTVDLPEGMPRDVFQTLCRTRVAGKPLQMSIARDGDAEAPRPAAGKKFHKKKHGAKGRGGKPFQAGKRRKSKSSEFNAN